MSFLLCSLLCSNLEFYPGYCKCSVMETLHSIIVPEELILTLCLFVFKSGASFGWFQAAWFESEVTTSQIFRVFQIQLCNWSFPWHMYGSGVSHRIELSLQGETGAFPLCLFPVSPPYYPGAVIALDSGLWFFRPEILQIFYQSFSHFMQ